MAIRACGIMMAGCMTTCAGGASDHAEGGGGEEGAGRSKSTESTENAAEKQEKHDSMLSTQR